MGYKYQTSDTKLIDYTEKLPIDLMMKVMAQDNDVKTNTLKGINDLSSLIPNKTFKEWQPLLGERTKLYEDEIDRLSQEFAAGKNVLGQVQSLTSTLNKDLKSGKLNALVSPYQGLLKQYEDEKKNQSNNQEDVNLAYSYAAKNPGNFYYDPETKDSPTVNMDAIVKRVDTNKYLKDSMTEEAFKTKLEGMGLHEVKGKDGKTKIEMIPNFDIGRLDDYHKTLYKNSSTTYNVAAMENIAKNMLLENQDYISNMKFNAKHKAGITDAEDVSKYIMDNADAAAKTYSHQFIGGEYSRDATIFTDENAKLRDDFAKMDHAEKLKNAVPTVISSNGAAVVVNGMKAPNGDIMMDKNYVDTQRANINSQVNRLASKANEIGLKNISALTNGDYAGFLAANKNNLETDAKQYVEQVKDYKYKNAINEANAKQILLNGGNPIKGTSFVQPRAMSPLKKDEQAQMLKTLGSMDVDAIARRIDDGSLQIKKDGRILNSAEYRQFNKENEGNLLTKLGEDPSASGSISPLLQPGSTQFGEYTMISGGIKSKGGEAGSEIKDEKTGKIVGYLPGKAGTKGYNLTVVASENVASFGRHTPNQKKLAQLQMDNAIAKQSQYRSDPVAYQAEVKDKNTKKTHTVNFTYTYDSGVIIEKNESTGAITKISDTNDEARFYNIFDFIKKGNNF